MRAAAKDTEHCRREGEPGNTIEVHGHRGRGISIDVICSIQISRIALIQWSMDFIQMMIQYTFWLLWFLIESVLMLF